MGAHFNEAGLRFLRGLKRNNDREWFNARKARYEHELKEPMLEVIGEVNAVIGNVAPEFVRDPAKTMMRIYRDIRFSGDKRPYKTHLAAWWARRGMEKTSGGGFYLEVSPAEVRVAAGVYMPEREQLQALRRHLLERHDEYRRLMAGKKLRAMGMEPIAPERMTRPPRGFAADHPAMDLVMQRNWGIVGRLPVEAALADRFAREVARRFLPALPLVTFLNEPLIDVRKPPL